MNWNCTGQVLLSVLWIKTASVEMCIVSLIIVLQTVI